VASAGVLFFLYRFLVRAIGIEAVGIWSVVLATTAVGRLADFGVAGSITRFVARALGQGLPHKAAEYAQTAILTAAAVFCVLGLIAYPILHRVLGLVIPVRSLGAATALLPYALASFWLASVGAVVQGAIDGTHRIDLRSRVVVVASLVYFVSAVVLVQHRGLLGLALAQLLQGGFVLVSSWIVLRRCLPTLPWLPGVWRSAAFKEVVAFGAQLQLISITILLAEPTTKALLARFGGLSAAGYFEMATRMVQQVRGLLISTNQVLVPAFADLQERGRDLVLGLYRDSFRVVAYLAVPLLSGLFALIPLISEWWIGHYEATFVRFAMLLAVGWFVNILCAPAYFLGVGTGQMRWNVLGNVTTGVVNVIGGITLGLQYDGTGVVVAAVVALSVGSLIILIMYHLGQGQGPRDLVPRESLPLVVVCLAAAVLGNAAYHLVRPHQSLVATTVVIAGVLVPTLSYAVWKHPLRPRLLAWAWTARPRPPPSPLSTNT
jgi:O-antigen/teichoic acid export membrane protein